MNKLTLVENWRKIARHSAVIKVALAGLIAPEVLQVIADNLELMPWLDADWKSAIRMLCLFAIPFVRVVQQPSISGEPS